VLASAVTDMGKTVIGDFGEKNKSPTQSRNDDNVSQQDEEEQQDATDIYAYEDVQETAVDEYDTVNLSFCKLEVY
jgi:hypothetical protein